VTDLDEITRPNNCGKDGYDRERGAAISDDEEMLGAMSRLILAQLPILHPKKQMVKSPCIIETSSGTVQLQKWADSYFVVTTRPPQILDCVRIEIKKACRQLIQAVCGLLRKKNSSI